MTPPDDWSDLSQVWTEGPPEPLRPDPDLIRRLRRRARLARLNFIVELAGGAVVLAVLVWSVAIRDLVWPAALAAVLFVAFALVMTLWSRRDGSNLLTDTPQAVLRSAIGQARLGRRWAWAGVAISLAGLIFVAAIALLVPPESDRSVATLLIGVIVLIGCIAGYGAHARGCRRRIAAHEAALRALSEP
ncbi:hypothetical protein [Brevundimonas sp.]|uniref:hypothetical protein n=1 Tax=Brevundimonas sp. TaxID=1871086 RepID=UPI003D13036F